MAISDTQRPAERGQLFGHPRGLTFLFTTEMWERFSYYGMRSLLVLYMVKFVLLPENAGNVIGLGALRSFYESIFGPLGDAAVRVAHLRPLHRARLSHAAVRRHAGRPRARPAPHRGARRLADGDRPFHDGVRAAVPVGAAGADLRQRRVQAQHLRADRRALRARRSAPRPRLFDLLCRHQSRRLPRAAGLRHARRGRRLALRLRRRRRRHDHRAHRLSLRRADAAGRRARPAW